MRNILLSLLMLTAAAETAAQKIDFDYPGRSTDEVTEEGYEHWAVGRVFIDSARFAKSADSGDSIQIFISNGNTAATSSGTYGLCANWSKNVVKNGSKLVGDGVSACILDDETNIVNSTDEAMNLQLIIRGLDEGEHTLMAYHNASDGAFEGKTIAPVDIYVNGEKVEEAVEQTGLALSASKSGLSYIRITVPSGGGDVKVNYISAPEEGTEYATSRVYINALVFDGVNSRTQAHDPSPSKDDMHAAVDNATAALSWSPAEIAVRHHILFGTSTDNMEEISVTTDTQYVVSDLSPLVTYYWRVDEEDSEGGTYEGDVWYFQPRRDAFPGAEGYGRYAIGGRIGSVYHVTSLADDGSRGTFRYGIDSVSGPRTIVFDVAGEITLTSRLTCSDKYVTIAGQTAPAGGIMLRNCPFGMQSDGITRFLRMRLGHKLQSGESVISDEDGANGLDGMGMAGNEHSIMDHCSISWTIDEGFSSRNAKTMTLQRTLISETLNCAGHPNYSAGTCHGYAATIGGGEYGGLCGSYHHNLLVHNEGRNWSISGGLDGAGAYDGHHDVFNNVVYNWGGRATDGGTHEMNFVNNYYKKGAATTQTYLLNLQLEGTGTGTQSAYVSGNIREETTGVKTEDKLNTTYKYTLSNNQTLDWEPFADAPFFESEATIEETEAAYKNVLSDVGCNEPFFDYHDQRMVKETLTRTYTCVGSKTGKKGLIDSEEDEGCEGFDLEKLGITEAARDADFDTDGDGIPDWYEEAAGTDPVTANNNKDSDGDGYTDLEDYLNYMALPHFNAPAGEETTVTLSAYFAGYDSPAYSIFQNADEVTSAIADGSLTVTPSSNAAGLFSLSVKAEENGVSLTRKFNFYNSDGFSGIVTIAAEKDLKAKKRYNLKGQRVNGAYKGIVIINGKKKTVE